MTLLKTNCFQIYDQGVVRQGMMTALRADPQAQNAIYLYIEHERFLLTQIHKAGFGGFTNQEYAQLHRNGIKEAEFSYSGGFLALHPVGPEHFVYIDVKSAHVVDQLTSFEIVKIDSAGNLEVLFTKGDKNTKQIIFLKVQWGTSFQTI